MTNCASTIDEMLGYLPYFSYMKMFGYKYYGGRGIIICEEWKESFLNFESWASNNGYSNTLTLDKINNDKNYSPSNCRWVSMKEQSLNKKMYKNNTTGVRGVYMRRNGRYRAEIKDYGKTIVLGLFDDINDAMTARKQAELKYYGKLLG